MEQRDWYAAWDAEKAWLTRYAAMHAARDEHIRHARQLGMTVASIARLVGLSRQHVSGIVREQG